MATQIVGKQCLWSGKIDSAGYRTYKIAFKIKADYEDGPATVMQTPGLFLPGSPWEVDNDIDIWAWCRPDMDVKILSQKDGEKSDYWLVEQTFSNAPLDFKIQRCHEIRIEDPLLEPQKISGGGNKKTIEATHDRFGNPLVNSSWEQLRGGMVEFAKDTDSITIEQNVISLDLPLVQSMKNTVNKFPLWGMPARCILFTDFKWEEKFYGLCYKYYTRKFTFEIRDDTWDQTIVDEGTKVLNGHWAAKPEDGPKGRWILDDIDGSPPNPLNPQHFIRFTDFNGNTTKVILDGFGQPYNPRLNDTTEGCEQCPSGMSRYLEIVNGEEEFEGSFQEQVLAYSSGCLWGNAGMSLEYNTEDDRWYITDLDLGITWRTEEGEWSCDGENTFTIQEDQTFNQDVPGILITQNTLSRPGSKLVQYYNEKDFSLLGIPMVL